MTDGADETPKRRVALDAMGGDNAPGEIVLGAIQAAQEQGIGVWLVGPEETLRAELARLHERLGVTTVYVTHDQVEAMTLGQRVTVLRDGKVQQADTPLNLYRNPVNLFVAALQIERFPRVLSPEGYYTF
jgi:hypothetical protein